MEDSSLNQAHGENRKADRLLRGGHFDKAIECHEKAIGHLAEAMTSCDLIGVQQSLAWQRDHHLRQVWLLQSKIVLLQALKKKKMDAHASVSGSRSDSSKARKEVKALQSSILRTLSDADSALHSHASGCEQPDPNLKRVMECHDQLRQLLEELFSLDFQPSGSVSTAVDLTVTTGSSSILPVSMQTIESSSPSLANPQSVSTEEDERTDPADDEPELPALAPLEVPQFDFNLLSSDPYGDD